MYLSAEDIRNLAAVRKVHRLNDKAVRLNRSLGDAVGLKNLGVHIIDVPPGAWSTEYHSHDYEEECIYVLSGTGVARLGAGRQRIAAGDFIGCPINGVAHDLHNDGDENLVCLVVGQRLAQDVADYPERNKRLYRNSGRWELVARDAIEDISPQPD
jgi:uncharacterized cupin superfamily protein